MIQIAKCTGENKGTVCSRREQCLRFTIPEREKWQNWMFIDVMIPDMNKCRFYWSNSCGEETSGGATPQSSEEVSGSATKASNTQRQNKVPKKRKTQTKGGK